MRVAVLFVRVAVLFVRVAVLLVRVAVLFVRVVVLYELVLSSRLLKLIGLSCKRTLQIWVFLAKET